MATASYLVSESFSSNLIGQRPIIGKSDFPAKIFLTKLYKSCMNVNKDSTVVFEVWLKQQADDTVAVVNAVLV